MAQVSPFLRKTAEGYAYWCPGCKEAHHVWTDRDDRPRWGFNGDVNRPTFTPSVRHFWPAQPARGDEPAEPERTFCHYFITDGQIQFCGDCEHELAGKTVPLPPLTDAGDYGWGDS